MDDKVEGLSSMFPTLDRSIIRSTLVANGSDEERSVVALLSLTDDTFHEEASRPAEDVLRSQSDLDAAYAHQLAMDQEQQEQVYRAHRQQQQQSRQEPSFDPSNVPYQARVRRGMNGDEQQQPQRSQSAPFGYGVGAQDGPGIEEQFNKLAVQGKAAVSSFLSSPFMKNVKEKVATAAVQAQDGLASLTQVKPAADSGINEPVRSRSQNDYSYQPQYTPSPGAAPRTQNPDYPAEDWAIPTSASATSSTASSINIYHSPPLASSATSPPQNYGSPPTAGKRSDELLRTSFGGRSSPSAGLSTSPQPSGLSSSPSAKIDFAKLGLLPKQKISLDGSSSKAASATVPASSTSTTTGFAASAAGSSAPVKQIPPVQAKGQDSDDDDLDYTKSPFEE